MMKTKFYALLFFLTVAMSGCDNEYDDTGIRPTDMSADCGTVMIEFGIRAHE